MRCSQRPFLNNSGASFMFFSFVAVVAGVDVCAVVLVVVVVAVGVVGVCLPTPFFQSVCCEPSPILFEGACGVTGVGAHKEHCPNTNLDSQTHT